MRRWQAIDDMREAKELYSLFMRYSPVYVYLRQVRADDWRVVGSGVPVHKEEHLNGRTYTVIKFPIRQAGKTMLAGYAIDITDRTRMDLTIPGGLGGLMAK